jgi:nucleoid DNA-binding protein
MTDNRAMHKRQLVDEVARRSGPWGLTRREVREALHGILDVITDEMADGNTITIAGFGRFEAKEHRGRRMGYLLVKRMSPRQLGEPAVVSVGCNPIAP